MLHGGEHSLIFQRVKFPFSPTGPLYPRGGWEILIVIGAFIIICFYCAEITNDYNAQI